LFSSPSSADSLAGHGTLTPTSGFTGETVSGRLERPAFSLWSSVIPSCFLFFFSFFFPYANVMCLFFFSFLFFFKKKNHKKKYKKKRRGRRRRVKICDIAPATSGCKKIDVGGWV